MGKINKAFSIIFLFAFINILFSAGCTPETDLVLLTPEERQWIDTHANEIVFHPELNYPPFSYINSNGELNGISKDYIELIENKLDLNIVFVVPQPLETILEQTQKGNIDIVGNLKKTEERSSYLVFTQPYIEVPAIIIVNENDQRELSLNDLQGMTVGVGQQYAIADYLKNEYPTLKIITYPDDLESLREVSFGELDSVVMDIASASFFIKQEGLTNLRVAGNTGFTYDLSFATQKENGVLIQILDKGLSQITTEEQKTLQNQYISLEQTPFYLQIGFWIPVAIVLGVSLLFIGITIAWNNTLARKVSNSTQELKHELASRKKVEHALRNSEARYHAMVDDQVEMVSIINPDKKLTFVNKAYCQFAGLSKSDLIGKEFNWLITEKDRELVSDRLSRITDSSPISEGQNRVIRGDGTVRWTNWINRGIFDENGKIIEYQSVGLDITENKLAEEELRNSEERYRSIFNTAGVALIEVDLSLVIKKINEIKGNLSKASELYLDTYHEYLDEIIKFVKLKNVNQNALDLYGISNKEELLTSINKTIIPETEKFFFDLFKEFWLENKYIQIETKSKTLDGRELFLYVVITISEEHPDRSLISITDISSIKQREIEMQQLARMGVDLRMTDETEVWFPKVIQSINELLNAPDAAIVIKNGSSGKMIIEPATGNAAAGMGSELPYRSIVGNVINSGKTFKSNDILNDKDLARQELVGNNKAFISVPLIANNQTFGALVAGRMMPFIESEINLLTTIAEMTAGNIYRGMLHQQVKKRLDHVQALQKVEHAINTITDKQIIMNLFLGQVISLFDISAGMVLELNQKINQLEFITSLGLRQKEPQTRMISLLDSFVGKSVLNRTMITINSQNKENIPPFLIPMLETENINGLIAIPLISKGRIRGVLVLMDHDPIEIEPDLNELMETFTNQAGLALENISIYEDIQASNIRLTTSIEDILQTWAGSIAINKEQADGHIQNIQELTVKIARVLGIREDKINNMRMGAILHDIGESVIPDKVLHKKAALDKDEIQLVQRHPEYAKRLLEKIAYLRNYSEIPYYHHERWDGSGYPKGLKSEDIPLSARIFAVVDVWDMLNRERPYRDAWPVDKIKSYLEQQSGVLFDPQVVEALFKVLDNADQDIL